MAEIAFPEALAFGGYDMEMTRGQALKVLEEAAELVEAVKACERHASDPRAVLAHAKAHVLDESMDVYQALANLLAGEFTDEEIDGAYAYCIDRNRERGRY